MHFFCSAGILPAMIDYKYLCNYQILQEQLNLRIGKVCLEKDYLLKELIGDFAGLGVLAVALTVKGIPLSIGVPLNSALISKT